MKTLVLYSSVTGNTKKLAKAVYQEISNEKMLQSVSGPYHIDDFDVVFIGYWVDKGICNMKAKKIIESFANKKLVLFATLGAKDQGAYYESIKASVEALIDESNQVLGHFLCQGGIQEKLTEKYYRLLVEEPDNEDILLQIENHKTSRTHPDDQDLEQVRLFVRHIDLD